MDISFRKYLILITLIGVLCNSAQSQDVFRTPAIFQSLGNASVSLQSPVALFSNPAGAVSTSFTVGILYDNRFLLKDLSSRSVFVVWPYQKNRFLFSFSQFGGDGYRENRVSFGLSKRLSPGIFGGIQFHYFSFYLAENSRRLANLVADLGVQYHSDDFGVGLQYFNPWGVSTQQQPLSRQFPNVVRFGLNKTFQSSFLISCEMYKEQRNSFEPRFGMQYTLKNQLDLRFGIETQSGICSFGIGTVFGMIHSDISFSYHQYLGFSPSVTIYFQRP